MQLFYGFNNYMRPKLLNYRFVIVISLISIMISLTLIFHVNLQKGTLFTHLFYFPIILSAFWWRKKGIIIAVVLALTLIGSHQFLRMNIETTNDYFRAITFIIVAYVTAVLSDKLKTTKENLASSIYNLNLLFNKSSTGMLVIDKNFKIQSFNNTFLKMFNLKKGNYINKNCFDVFQNNLCSTPSCPLQNALKSSTPYKAKITFQKDSEDKKFFQVASNPFYNSMQGQKHVILDFMDINDRINKEKEAFAYQKQLRAIASELSLAEERERRRLATNLHDSVSQTLFIAKMKTSALQNANDLQTIKDKLKEIYNYIDESHKEIRSLIFEISPPILYELGLTSAIEWLGEKIKKNHNITVKMHSAVSQISLDLDLEILVFQTMRELINNVVKHSNAKNVNISVTPGKSYLRCIVEDDGIGFNPESKESLFDGNSGFGLFNIKERLTHYEGNLIIDSALGKGTKATILTPLYKLKGTTNENQNNAC